MQPAFVPAALGGNVVAVLGLTNFPALQSPSARSARPAGLQSRRVRCDGNPTPTPCLENVNGTTGAPVCPRWYDPATYALAYDVGNVAARDQHRDRDLRRGRHARSRSADFRVDETSFGLPDAPST